MTKEDMACKVAKAINEPVSKGREIINLMISSLCHGLQNDGEVVLRGFGKFWLSEMSARTRHNPKTMEAFDYPEKKYVRFKSYRTLKNLVNQ